MKLSTRSKYGLRAMLVLAMHEGNEPVMTKEIAEKQNLPATYLEQLMLTLRKAELVNATRGAKGGYVLSRDPKNIQIIDIVETLEGPLELADCADFPNCCLDSQFCSLKDLFDDANKALRSVFEKYSLQDIADKQREKDTKTTQMYYI
jgi:Rrf2 family transcriptional regulator, cysteine metabolism repressor